MKSRQLDIVKHRSGSRRQRAFTLIELMVVVMIVAILAAIAYPSYVSQVRKGYRAGAQEFLLDIAQRQQQYFLDNRRYAPDLGTLGVSVPGELAGRYSFASVDNDDARPPRFTATATAIGVQAEDGNLAIDQTGVKSPSDKW